MSTIEDHLEAFDGVAISVLSEARAAFRDTDGYLEDLFRLCGDPRANICVGATWMLKAEADAGGRFATELTDRLVQVLDLIPSWQAKLHICQAIDAFDLTEDQARTVFTWSASLADHEKPFLRAWSLHAAVRLGLKFEELRPASEAALESAHQDPAASVRARARNLRKKR